MDVARSAGVARRAGEGRETGATKAPSSTGAAGRRLAANAGRLACRAMRRSSGIEKVLRELSCLSAVEYKSLGYPDAMSRLPDFTVMNREQTSKQFVEVKYRTHWRKNLFDEVREQVRLFGEIVLVSVNARAEDPKGINLPSRFLRCCGLKFDSGVYMVQHSVYKTTAWTPIHEIRGLPGLWWSMLQRSFRSSRTRRTRPRCSRRSARWQASWTERAPGAWPAPSVAPQAKLPVPRRLALVRNRVQIRWRATRAGPRVEMAHPFVERLTLAVQALRTDR